MVDFTKLPIGTRVETAYGPGKIVNTNAGGSFPIEVEVMCDFGRRRIYTKEGRLSEYDTHPTLFLAPFEWPTQEQPEQTLPDLPVDAPVMVRSRGYSWERRHFCRWENGQCVTYINGLTSFTSCHVTKWDEWRLPTESDYYNSEVIFRDFSFA